MDYEQIAQELKDYVIIDGECSIHPEICLWGELAIRNLIRERDATIDMLRGECHACKHNQGWHNVGECRNCIHDSEETQKDKKREDKWEWKGTE